MKKSLCIIILLCSYSFGQEAVEDLVPEYPESPICRNDSGEIILSYYINENGKPYKIEIEKTDSTCFSRPAIKTLTKYRFKQGIYSTNIKYHKSFNFNPERKCGHQA